MASTTPAHDAVRMHHQTYTTFRMRTIVAGDAAVGKTALIKLLTSGGVDYPRNYVMTSVPEPSSRILKVPAADLPIDSPPCQVDLVIFDTPGSRTFNMREISGQKHWETASAVVLVFDIGNRDSFLSVANWWARAQESFATGGSLNSGSSSSNIDSGALSPSMVAQQQHQQHGPLIGVLVGNKSDFRDVDSDRADVTAAEAKALADSAKMPYFEVSAERNLGIEKPFAFIASTWAKRLLQEEE